MYCIRYFIYYLTYHNGYNNRGTRLVESIKKTVTRYFLNFISLYTHTCARPDLYRVTLNVSPRVFRYFVCKKKSARRDPPPPLIFGSTRVVDYGVFLFIFFFSPPMTLNINVNIGGEETIYSLRTKLNIFTIHAYCYVLYRTRVFYYFFSSNN